VGQWVRQSSFGEIDSPGKPLLTQNIAFPDEKVSSARIDTSKVLEILKEWSPKPKASAPNAKSLQPTSGGAGSSAYAEDVIGPAWLTSHVRPICA